MHAVIFPVPTKIRERRQACTYILMQLPIKSNGSGLIQSRSNGCPKTYRTLAAEMLVGLGTIHRWKHRQSPEDRSCARKDPAYTMGPGEEALMLLPAKARRREALLLRGYRPGDPAGAPCGV